MRSSKISLCLLLLIVSTQASALYKWVDEAGNVHYGQTPPDKVDASTVNTKSVTEQPQSAEEHEKADSTPIEIPEEVATEARQQQADNCQTLFTELKRYEEGLPITDSEGNAIVVSEEMRDAKVTEIKSQLDEKCR